MPFISFFTIRLEGITKFIFGLENFNVAGTDISDVMTVILLIFSDELRTKF